MASIAAIGERNQKLQEQRAELERAKLKAQAAAAKAQREAQQGLLQTRTNAAWNEMLAKQAQASKKPTISLEEDTPLGKVKRSLTPAEYEHALAVKDYTSKLDLLNSERTTQQGRVFPGGRQVAEIDRDIAALNPPADLLSGSSDLVTRPSAPEPVALETRSPATFNGITSMTGPGWAPPRPTGIIGTPERNSFTAETDLPALNREGITNWAIANNTPATIPPDLLSAPFQPRIGDLRMAEAGRATAPAVAATDTRRWPTPPQEHVDALLEKPDAAAHFEEKYGPGSAAKYLELDDSQP